MTKRTTLFLFLSLIYLGDLFPLSSQDVSKIGDKVWKNECNGTIDGLTSWNKGENFASLGIGHFIWYSIGKEEHFQETFPDLLKFLETKAVALPDWLKNTKGCPWNTRDEFYQNFESDKMKSLRKLLLETKDLQAVFIVNRFEKALPRMTENLSKVEKDKITTTFKRLSQESNGLYALIDYLNWKGAGDSLNERYKGQGWGLLQVLLRIDPSSSKIVADFVQSAKDVLSKRIENSPPERNEERWRKGWFKRLDTYLTTS